MRAKSDENRNQWKNIPDILISHSFIHLSSSPMQGIHMDCFLTVSQLIVIKKNITLLASIHTK